MLKAVALLLVRNYSVGLGVLGCVVWLQSIIAQDFIVDAPGSFPFFRVVKFIGDANTSWLDKC